MGADIGAECMKTHGTSHLPSGDGDFVFSTVWHHPPHLSCPNWMDALIGSCGDESTSSFSNLPLDSASPKASGLRLLTGFKTTCAQVGNVAGATCMELCATVCI